MKRAQKKTAKKMLRKAAQTAACWVGWTAAMMEYYSAVLMAAKMVVQKAVMMGVC